MINKKVLQTKKILQNCKKNLKTNIKIIVKYCALKWAIFTRYESQSKS